MKVLANEITRLKEALAVATDDLAMAQANLDNEHIDWARRWLEKVYFDIFMLSQRSDLKIMLAKSKDECKAKEKH